MASLNSSVVTNPSNLAETLPGESMTKVKGSVFSPHSSNTGETRALAKSSLISRWVIEHLSRG